MLAMNGVVHAAPVAPAGPTVIEDKSMLDGCLAPREL